MVSKQLSIGNVVVFDKRSNPHHHHSNFRGSPIKPRYSFSVRFDQENPKKRKSRITKKEIEQLVSWKKEVAAEHKQVQDSCLLRTKNPPPPPPPAGSISDHDDHPLFLDQSSAPVFDEPVRFDFGDDYDEGRLFLDLRRELRYRTACDAWSRRAFFSTVVEDDDDGVGSLASETDMMNLFFKDNLF